MITQARAPCKKNEKETQKEKRARPGWLAKRKVKRKRPEQLNRGVVELCFAFMASPSDQVLIERRDFTARNTPPRH